MKGTVNPTLYTNLKERISSNQTYETVMRTLLVAVLICFSFTASFSQSAKLRSKKYPSLLWAITGKGLTKPSYLFGTMHVSSKMAFHLSDSFYLGLKNADIVALETNPGNWQEDFSRYNLDGTVYSYTFSGKGGYNEPNDYLSINTLKAFPYDKLAERALYSNPSIINSFLYRTNSDVSSDFEEDTYLDLYIYQVGRKWNKRVCGVENFDESMTLMKEAYVDAAKDKNLKERNYDIDRDFSYGKLEEAYRTGNLDLVDTINKVNSRSAAFDEKFLYKRNEIQAASIDSILKSQASLFVGVGAAHLPGERGVIELLRKKGYQLRPIKMTERDSRHKDEIEKIRVPVPFSRQTSEDGFYSVSLPGKLYSFNRQTGLIDQRQYADMSNGSYYMISRIFTNAALWGHSIETVQRKVDSVLYENIPGKILSKKNITKNGYKGFDIVNRTRRGDYQHYNIFITPFEVILFKISGNGDYVEQGKEAAQFFSSIQFKEYKPNWPATGWRKYCPSFGGFEVEMPHPPLVNNASNWQFLAYDPATSTNFEVIRTDVHNFRFVEEDSLDLSLLEESFSSSEFIEKQLSRRPVMQNGYAALDAKYKYKDGSVALVKFLIQGPHYYTLIANGKTENRLMNQFLNSFAIKPFVYGKAQRQSDTTLFYSVASPVPVQKKKKLSLYPEELYRLGTKPSDDDGFLEENGTYKDKLVENDSTGEKIYVSFYKPSRYNAERDSIWEKDSTHFKTQDQDWIYRSRKEATLPDKMKVLEYELGDPKSSRIIRGKSFRKGEVYYNLIVQGDSVTKWSSFVTDFFNSFHPADTVKGVDPAVKKTTVFFSDFFNRDTLQHRRAVKNIPLLRFDSSDFSQLKKAIQVLSWNEKKYLDIKNSFVFQLSTVSTKASADYLKEIYYAAGDTVDLQYTALEALLQQRTAYAYQVFRDIMVNEPPVLNYKQDNSPYSDDYKENLSNRNFMDELKDSLPLTKTIIKELLPLININDYEQTMIDLLQTLVDSNVIAGREYEVYLPKFLIEAKQEMKKQVINEKNKSIENAQNGEAENSSKNSEDKDEGNTKLVSYATLLMPFWNANASVPQLFQQMLTSTDKGLKYNIMLLMLRNAKPVPDTLLNYFASQDAFRFELYTDLRGNKLLSLFPASFNNHIDLAKSELVNLNSYQAPDTIAYIDKLPLQFRDRNGLVYFFKYRQNKDDNSWKLATVGLIPSDPKEYRFEKNLSRKEEYDYNFTEITKTKIDEDESLKEQLEKALKKKAFSKRKSGAQFYDAEEKNDVSIPGFKD
jgi:uncharacterized protein YbaP (TraB family)